MSQANLQAVERIIDAYNRSDVDSMVEVADPESVFNLPSPSAPGVVSYQGHDGLRRLVAAAEQVWTRFDIEVEHVLDADPYVLVYGWVHAESRRGAVALRSRLVHVYRLRGGRVVEAYFSIDPSGTST